MSKMVLKRVTHSDKLIVPVAAQKDECLAPQGEINKDGGRKYPD